MVDTERDGGRFPPTVNRSWAARDPNSCRTLVSQNRVLAVPNYRISRFFTRVAKYSRVLYQSVNQNPFETFDQERGRP